MTFLAPDPTGAAGTLGLNGDQGIPPLTPNGPNALKALTRKWGSGNIQAVQQHYGPDATNALVKWEFERAQRGISPMNPTNTLKLLQTAQSGQAATPAPERDPWDVLGNAAADVKDIVTGIPKMPVEAVHDVIHSPEILSALATGDVEKIAQAPVIRMIPGVYTASNLIEGNFSELASHPVQTALDVAPYAKMLHVGEHVGNIPIPGSEEGLTLRDVGQRAKASFNRSMPGQFMQEAFSDETRTASRILAEESNKLGQRALPEFSTIYDSSVDRIRQDATPRLAEFDKAFADTDPAVKSDVVRALADPASFGVKTAGEALTSLPLDDAQLAAADRLREWQSSAEQFGMDSADLHKRVVNGVTETFNTQQAARVDSIQTKLAHMEAMTNLRESILHPENADLESVLTQTREAINRPRINTERVRSLAQGLTHALDVAGYDTETLLQDINASGKRRTQSLITDLNVSDFGQRGSVIARPARGVPALDARTRWLDRSSQYTLKKLDKARDVLGTQQEKVIPARWKPAFQRVKIDAAHSYIEEHFAADDPHVPAMMEAVNNHMYATAFSPEEISAINKEALKSIEDLRQAGYNPEYVHAVSPEQERSIASPSVTTIVPKAGQYGTRINDWTPSANSLSVSVSHQALELGRRQAAQVALERLREPLTQTVRDASADLMPTAERFARRNGTPVGAELEKLMRKTYVRWNETEAGFNAGRAGKFKFSDTQLRPDELVVPRHVSRALEMIASPPAYSRIFDPVLKVFRTAVLPFSPRFHLNNIVGGIVMSSLEDPRILAKLPEAMRVSSEMEKLSAAYAKGDTFALSEGVKNVIERMPEEMRAQFGGLKYSVSPENEWRRQAGGKLGEFAQQAGIDRLLKAGKRAEDWSYSFNELNDNMYRVAAYLSGEENALTKGLSAEEAGARGMALANKVQPRWLEMTPMERSVFRVVFPFYGFMSHLYRFAMRYPVDHPWRTAVMANFARAEMDDLGTGLPQALASAFFLGSPDKLGNVTAITPGAANPFRDLGDNMTLAGFMGQTNPLFKAALVQLGYDPSTRGPNLYPQVQYDPETGKFKAVQTNTPGLFGEVAGALVPQVNIVRALTGTSGDFRNLLETNPDAANRMMMSATGIPLLWRKYNVYDEQFSAEANRQTDAKNVLSDALKTGDYSHLEKYPSLRPYLDQLRTLAANGKLLPFEAATQANYQPPSLATNNSAQVGSQATTQAEARVS